jgi:hypothetical protein
MIGHGWKRLEDSIDHVFDFTEAGEQVSRPGR